MDAICSLLINTGKLCDRDNYIMTKQWTVKVCVWDHLKTLIQCAHVPGSPRVCVCDSVHTLFILVLLSVMCYSYLSSLMLLILRTYINERTVF